MFLHEFNLGHNFVLWHCSATCCQDDTARPQVAWMTLQKLTDLGCEILPHLPYSLDPTTIFPNIATLFMPKSFCSKREVESAFIDFLESKTLQVYCTGINNLVNRWLKCIDVQELFFDWLKQRLNLIIKHKHLSDTPTNTLTLKKYGMVPI